MHFAALVLAEKARSFQYFSDYSVLFVNTL